MKGFGDNKGITLAVLIVTIVVLLILAGITIANITGGDGILGQAQGKKDEATIQKEKNILGSAVMTASNKTKLGDLTEDNLRDALSNKNVDIVKSGGLYKITFKDTNNLYKMNENGEYFYWENMQPTKVYGKIEDNILYLRATEETGYTEGTQWNDNTITKVIIEEPIAPSTCVDMFKSCTSLEKIENIENLHTENATNMYGMFYNCKKLYSLNLTYFDTSKVTTMRTMFSGCSSLTNLNLNNFNTSNTTDMQGMFSNCISLSNLNINHFDTSKVTNMDSMFGTCNSLTKLDVSSFNTSKVVYMSAMFAGCNNLITLNITNFDTSKVTAMTNMFQYCSNLVTLDLSSFDTNKVQIMQGMFYHCYALKKIIVSNNFKTEKTTTSTYMFSMCSNIVGGSGTKYNSSYIDKTYARIDNLPDEPGYFTLKQ